MATRKTSHPPYYSIHSPKDKSYIETNKTRKLTFFQPPAAPPDRRPIVVSGPSGVGKGTLYGMLFDRHPDTFALSVSHTTRAPRPGEVDGVHYHFVSMDAFEDLIARDGFVENAKYGRNRYGTSKMTIEEQTKKGKVVVLDIEMEVRLTLTLTCLYPTHWDMVNHQLPIKQLSLNEIHVSKHSIADNAC